MKKTETVHGGNVDQFAREYGLNPREVLDFSSNINPTPFPPEIKERILPRLEELRRYPDREYLELRRALAAYTGCPVEWIMVGNGATELIYLTVKAFKPQKVIIPVPSFADYERAFDGSGARVDFFRLREEYDFKPNIDEFLHELNKGYEMTILCNPNNPTGYLIPKSDLLRVLEETRRLKITVLLDETFIEFVPEIEAASITRELAAYDNVILLRALTKFFAVPGLRLGYCLAQPQLLQQMAAFKEPWTVNAFANILGPFLLRHQKFYEESRAWILTERPYLYERLQQMEGLRVYESYASFFLLKILHGDWNVNLLKSMLISEHIMIRDASSFTYLDQSFFRIAVKDRKSNDKLLDALHYFLY